MSSKKLNIGPLPQQTDDYSHLEETVVRWDRIALAGGAVALLLVVISFGLFSPGGSSSDSSTEDVTTSVPSPVAETEHKEPSAARNVISTLTPASKQSMKSEDSSMQAENKVSLETADNLGSSTASLLSAKSSKPTAVGSIELEKPMTQLQADLMAKNPISVVENGIVHAQLTSNVEFGKPVDKHSAFIPMSDEGIIKVVIYNEFQNISGTTLFHDWYQGEKRVARVKIPVSKDGQRSSSSKFINKQMLGDWSVKVVDSSDKLYLFAEFTVQ